VASAQSVIRFTLWLGWLSTTPAASTEPVVLRHGLEAGSLNVYELVAETTRTRCGPTEDSQLASRQEGRLVVYLLETVSGRTRRVQMLSLRAAQVREYSRQRLPVHPLPSSADLGLDPGGVYMTIDELTPAAAPPFIAPPPDSARPAFWLLLGELRWPEEGLRVGQSWSLPAARESLEGGWHWTLRRVEATPTNRTGLLGWRLEPASTRLQSSQFEAATAELIWDLEAGRLVRFSGMGVFRERRPEFDERSQVRPTLSLGESRAQSPAEQRRTRSALQVLADAVAAERQGSVEAALQKARDYLARWPESPWRPVADQLVERLTARPERPSQDATVPDDSSLQQQLAAAVEQWQAATRDQDGAVLRQLRTWFEQTAAANHDKVMSLLGGEDPGPRAVAVFALAFSGEGLDLIALQGAAADRDGRVRAWVAYALATRADPRTEFRTLAALAGDEDPNVRARACEAVGACVTPDSPRARPARMLLLARLRDDFDGVRLQAGLALLRLATPEDRPQIEAVRNAETQPAVEDVLDRLVERLRVAQTGTK